MHRVKELIRERGLTQEEFATQLGMTRVAFNQMINRNPSLSSLKRIADALGVQMWELFATREDVGKEELIGIIRHRGQIYTATSVKELSWVIDNIKLNSTDE